MKRFLSQILFVLFLKNPRLTAGVGLLLLCALTWMLGPIMGLPTVEGRLIAIVALLILGVVLLMIDLVRADRGARMLEASLQGQGRDQADESRPDRKEEIEAVRLQFEKAIATLKQSKLGSGRQSASALYALPWYMFIGPPASGKTTALLNSGLPFPNTGKSKRGIQGIGGTRNCDWWFTSDAILLDTAGRYVTEEDDKEEWLGFLNLLTRYRKGKPINGVLAAISVTDIISATDDELEAHAKNIRERIDELISHLGIVPPIYLLYTKCDLLSGFTEFFEDFSKQERDQIWGATFSLHDKKSHAAPETVFMEEFDRLIGALQSRRLARLASTHGSRKLKDIYSFPMQMASLRERLSQFVEILFASNPYQENPIFRGFYFTSGTQEGTPIDRVLGVMGSAYGIDPLSESQDSQKESKSYFIKNLFTDVVFTDQNMVGHSSRMQRKKGIFKAAFVAASVLFMLLGIAGLTFSFVANKRLIGSLERSHLQAVQLFSKRPSEETNIALLGNLMNSLKELQGHKKDGIPLHLRLGLYRGDVPYPPLRDLYLHLFNRTYLAPTRQEIERTLSQLSNAWTSHDSDWAYSQFKLYLMLSDKARFDMPFVEKWLTLLWLQQHGITPHELGSQEHPTAIPATGPGKLESVATEQILFYTQNLHVGATPNPVNERLVKQVRRILQEIPLSNRLYDKIRRESDELIDPYTLAALFGRAPQTILESTASIPGLYTRRGYEMAFEEAVQKSLTQVKEEGWVLGVPNLQEAAVQKEIEQLYFKDYTAHWMKFLESIRMPAGSLTQSAKLLETLSEPNSPLAVLLADTAQNTWKRDEGGVLQSGGRLLDKVREKVGLDQKPEKVVGPIPVTRNFQSLHTFIASSEEGKAPLYSLYLTEIQAIREVVVAMADQASAEAPILESQQILRTHEHNTERLLSQGLSPEIRRVIGPLLLSPFQRASSTMMGSRLSNLNRQWDEVFGSCQQAISGRYPFVKEKDEATLTDLADFFHPESGALWRFYNKHLKSFVEESPERWTVRAASDGGMAISSEFLESLRQASLISESLFPRGGVDPKVAFSLYPYPTPDVSEILIQVDGKEFRYRNEPQERYEFVWPGEANQSGALLRVTIGGEKQQVSFPGRWGFFRLLDVAQITPMSSNRFDVAWDFRKKDGNGGGKFVRIHYEVRAESSKNPFKPGLFSRFRCVKGLG